MAPPLVGHWVRFVEGGMPVFPNFYLFARLGFCLFAGRLRAAREREREERERGVYLLPPPIE